MKGKRRKAKGKSNEDGSFTAFRMTRSGGRRQGAMVSTAQARGRGVRVMLLPGRGGAGKGDGVSALCCRVGVWRLHYAVARAGMQARGDGAHGAGKGTGCPRYAADKGRGGAGKGDRVPALCCREGVWRLHYAVARAGMQARGDGVHGAGKGRGVRAMLRGRWEKADSASAEDIKAHPKGGPKVALWMC